VARTTQEDLERIWRVVASIPPGRVESYGSVARRAGLPRRARLVGHALKVAPEELGLPWHRVVNAAGRISFPEGSAAHLLQRRRLEAEGLQFRGAAVVGAAHRATGDLDALLWAPPGAPAARRAR
jgi:methylated-DNA-protein-cysteine methyltransferase-like protein